jgi:trigger factor
MAISNEIRFLAAADNEESMAFTVTTEPREHRQLAVTIEVSQDQVDKELRKAAAKIAGQYRIPGFRKGKAPYHIVVQQLA